MSGTAVLCAEGMPVAGDESYSSIRLENPLTQADWDARISGQSGISFFHGSAWAKVLAGTYGFAPRYFAVSRGQQLVALLPLMEVNSWLTGKRGVSLPFTDFCEPFAAKGTSLGPVVKEVLQYGRKCGWKHVEFRGFPGITSHLPGAEPSVSFFTHQLKIFSDTDFLFARFESSCRRAIRKAQKSGLTIETAQSREALLDYYGLHCITRKDHGLPPQPLAFFLNIHQHVLSQNQGMIVTARHEGRPVASAMFFHAGPDVIYKFGASDAAGQELRANNLVMWEAIQWCARNGKSTLNFGRTSSSNDGLRRYKLGWTAVESEVRYHKYDLRQETFVGDRDDASGWHNRVFRALPTPMSRWAGSLLYRHMA
jgi:hypothetical protein